MLENTPPASSPGDAFGVKRRTVVAGASWTIPVVATAIGAPLAAASTTSPTLAFTNGPYSVTACGTLKDVVIEATTDGTTPAPAGTIVTVTLPTGLTWSDGTTGSRALPTDANGHVTLTGIEATSASRTATITATEGAASASAPVSVTASSGAAHQWILTSTGGGVYQNVVPVPTSSQPVGVIGWLDNGTLYRPDGSIVATNVATAESDIQNWGTANQQRYTWTDTSGAAHQWMLTSTGGGVYQNVVPVPSGSQPVGVIGWLNNGILYNNSGSVIATNVAAAESSIENWGTANQQRYSWTDTSGAAHQWILTSSGGGVSQGVVPVPHGSQPIGVLGWLNNGTLYNNSGSVIATNVATVSSDIQNWGTANQQRYSWTDTSGAAHQWILTSSGGGVSQGVVPVPNGSQPIGVLGWLNNGTLYNNSGSVIATNVATATSDIENWGTANQQRYTWTDTVTC